MTYRSTWALKHEEVGMGVVFSMLKLQSLHRKPEHKSDSGKNSKPSDALK
jgi:hypothetical protein